MSTHRCAAVGCPKMVDHSRLMCLAHWRLVPKNIQNAIWREYRPGQDARTATDAYLAAMRAAIKAVQAREAT